MSIRAKFKCQSVTDHGTQKEAKLTAVASTTGENADFTKYTPAGSLEITIWSGTNAADFFKPQKDYYLDFTEVPE